MTENSTSPCAGGKCVPKKGSLSGVCAYTPPKYDKKSDKKVTGAKDAKAKVLTGAVEP